MAGFERATMLTSASEGGAATRWSVQLDPEWTVAGRPHGGYVLAALARAAVAATPGQPHPLSASAVYASPPEVGPATVHAEVIRQGRRISQVRGRLTQNERTLVDAVFVTGTADPSVPEVFTDAPPPDVAPIEDCQRSPVEPFGPGFRVAMLDQVGAYLDPAWARSGTGDLRGWLTFDDGADFDALRLIFACDAFPPATITLGSVGWVPTLELTVYLRLAPVAGPLRVRQQARVLGGGLVDQVCQAWSPSGRVVFQATQLAAVRLPPA